MRLVTWNCCSGDVRGRLRQLARLKPHLVVLQEVAQPAPASHDPQVHWRGTTPRKGVAIIACGDGYPLAAVAAPPEVAPYTCAAVVQGPTLFLLVAMWAHPKPNYADNAIAVVRDWRAREPTLPLVVAGDFNVELRAPFATAQHRRLAALLHDECGLVSAYHAHNGLHYGHGEAPTYRHLRKAHLPWHIDYCFVPAGWTSRITSATVVDSRIWRGRSDHAPVVVDWED